MSHIEELTLNKFRVFENEFRLNLTPLTFLTGPNSSGKSSIFKSFLLLKSNHSSTLQVLDFTGDKHNLGTFDNTINKKKKKEDVITFGLTTTIKSDFPFSFYKEPVTTKRSVFYILKEEGSLDSAKISIELDYKKNDRSGKLSKIEITQNLDEKPFLILKIAGNNQENHSLLFDYNLIIKNKVLRNHFVDHVVREKVKIPKIEKVKSYQVSSVFKIQDGGNEAFYDEPVLVFSKLFKLFLDDNLTMIQRKDLHPFMLKQPLKRILQDFSSIIENTEYIEAVRANTRRLYTNDSQGTGFNELILDYTSREIDDLAIKFINKWLKAFEIADEIIFKNVEGVATSIYLKSYLEEIALADLGYGITQFLPILLKIALEQPVVKKRNHGQIVKKLILLEEPETNLHPKLQSLLADFLVDALITFEIRLIIETHSEYIIRRMQVMTAEKIVNSEETSIYYFNSPSQTKEGLDQIIEIKILENGSLSKDFGEGFFDEATRMKFELLRIKSKQ